MKHLLGVRFQKFYKMSQRERMTPKKNDTAMSIGGRYIAKFFAPLTDVAHRESSERNKKKS